MSENLLILGTGQYGTVVKEIAKSMECFGEIAFLDDCFGTDNLNYHEDAIGRIENLEEYRVKYAYAIPAIGEAGKRLELIAHLEEYGFRIPVIVSPSAYVSPSAQLQKGAVVEPLAGVHANVVISTGAYVSAGAIINHNSVVFEGCHIDNNAVVMCGVIVAAKTYIAPCEVVKKQALKLTFDKDGHVVQETTESIHQIKNVAVKLGNI